jgi:hypothetical protein
MRKGTIDALIRKVNGNALCTSDIITWKILSEKVIMKMIIIMFKRETGQCNIICRLVQTWRAVDDLLAN